MAVLFYNYTNYGYFKTQSLKTTLQTNFSSFTQAVLHCQSLSDAFPTQSDGSTASNTPIINLECQTTPSYALDGHDSFFMPMAPNGFDAYTATQNGSEFYLQTAASEGSDFAKALEDLNTSYSPNQYTLNTAGGKINARYYISR